MNTDPLSRSRPRNLVFVRHGESEANIVQIADKKGDSSGYTEEFRNVPNSQKALTPRGVEQAEAAGAWIRENIQGGIFDDYYVSSFRRARQTAGHLHLPEGETKKIWKERDYLREQSWGLMDNMTVREREEKYPEFMAIKKRDGVHWPGLGGESMADLVFRAKVGIIATLYRELPNKSGIVVSHGNTLWAIRIVLEGLTFGMYHELDDKKHPLEKMNNCQILHYTRVDPQDPSRITDNFTWMRSVCPWDTTLSRNEWQEIKRARFTNAELLSD